MAALELELEASEMLGRDSMVTAGLVFFSMAVDGRVAVFLNEMNELLLMH